MKHKPIVLFIIASIVALGGTVLGFLVGGWNWNLPIVEQETRVLLGAFLLILGLSLGFYAINLSGQKKVKRKEPFL